MIDTARPFAPTTGNSMTIPALPTPTLLVLHTEHLEACRTFCADLGLQFAREQHGAGPEHYAAELPGGLVLELYPATARRPVSSNRLGFRASAEATGLAPGQHVLQDPDGRAVEVHVGA